MRFYGGTAEDWLSKTPVRVWQSCLRALPRIRAQESLAAFSAAACGTHSKRGPWMSKQLREWSRASASGGPKVRPKPADLAAMGIAVKVVRSG